MNEDQAAPLGERVAFAGARRPNRIALHGSRVTVRPLDPGGDAEALYEQSHAPTGDPSVWRYLHSGPYPDLPSYRAALAAQAEAADPLAFVITGAGGDRALGQISYMSIVPEHGRIELGQIWFGAGLKRTAEATEAFYLLARHAFDDLGNRRLEWKCDALNEPSRRAALRFGFEPEGVFRRHQVVKGRNRDTAWFAITDERWPAVRGALQEWLAPGNFDASGAQVASLRQLTANLPKDSTLS
jgi:RimJ/RimL family protein N-acetyltransferase